MLPLVYQALQANSDVVAFVGENIYRHGEAPDDVDGNYITWFIVAGTPENTLDERPRVDRQLIQIDCWGNNDGTGDEEVEELATAVRDTLEADHHMNGIVINGKDPETKRYRIGMTFTWWNHREPFVEEEEAPVPYTGPGATLYDAIVDYQRRVDPFVGLVDGKKGTFSFWARPDLFTNFHAIFGCYGPAGSNEILEIGFGGGFALPNRRLYVYAATDGYVDQPIIGYDSTPTAADSVWKHWLISWDVGANLFSIYRDDVYSVLSFTLENVNLNYSKGDWQIAHFGYGGGFWSGCLAEMFFHPDYLDLSLEANRRKFITADLRPVYLGADGELPFGAPPIFYSPQGDNTNLGVGGNFATIGAPAPCGVIP